MNTDAQILHIVLADWLQQSVKTIICHSQEAFIPGMQGQYIKDIIRCHVLYYLSQREKYKFMFIDDKMIHTFLTRCFSTTWAEGHLLPGMNPQLMSLSNGSSSFLAVNRWGHDLLTPLLATHCHSCIISKTRAQRYTDYKRKYNNLLQNNMMVYEEHLKK